MFFSINNIPIPPTVHDTEPQQSYCFRKWGTYLRHWRLIARLGHRHACSIHSWGGGRELGLLQKLTLTGRLANPWLLHTWGKAHLLRKKRRVHNAYLILPNAPKLDVLHEKYSDTCQIFTWSNMANLLKLFSKKEKCFYKKLPYSPIHKAGVLEFSLGLWPSCLINYIVSRVQQHTNLTLGLH